MELVPIDLLTEKQTVELVAGLIPHLSKNLATEDAPGGATHWAALGKDDRVAGLLSVYRLNDDGMGEISVNFFAAASPAHIRLLDGWAWKELADYYTLIARVYRWNTPIKRILQRFGFKLFGTTGNIEVYAVKRPDILRLRRNHGND